MLRRHGEDDPEKSRAGSFFYLNRKISHYLYIHILMIFGKPHQIAIKSFFALFGIFPAKSRKYEQLIADQTKVEQLTIWLNLLKRIPEDKVSYFARNIEFSHSQFFQDLFVSSELAGKRDGFFVEVGACDGQRLSNSLFFERNLGWEGILADPGKSWHRVLMLNRKALIDKRAVWQSSGVKLLFNETQAKEISTLAQYSDIDFHADLRKKGTRYEVETITLGDLLETHSAPPLIDYLSIDTKGSEFEILSTFDFKKRLIRCITCEHNYSANRDKIYKLVTSKGYRRKFVEFSDVDDWYFIESQ